jgi:hypothetical protein
MPTLETEQLDEICFAYGNRRGLHAYHGKDCPSIEDGEHKAWILGSKFTSTEVRE